MAARYRECSSLHVVLTPAELRRFGFAPRWLGLPISTIGVSVVRLRMLTGRLANMFLPFGTATYQFSLPDSGDAGAEAW